MLFGPAILLLKQPKKKKKKETYAKEVEGFFTNNFMVESLIREKHLDIARMYNNKTCIFVSQATYKRWKSLELLKISMPLKCS